MLDLAIPTHYCYLKLAPTSNIPGILRQLQFLRRRSADFSSKDRKGVSVILLLNLEDPFARELVTTICTTIIHAVTVYQTLNEGLMHAPKFRSTVLVDGVKYTSESTFSNKSSGTGCGQACAGDTIFCKSILNEFVAKMNLEGPTYTTIWSEGLVLVFVSTLVFNGVTYKGETGRTKKEAEQLTARAAIQSLLVVYRDHQIKLNFTTPRIKPRIKTLPILTLHLLRKTERSITIKRLKPLQSQTVCQTSFL
ncbi:hypothetical protein GQ457_15G030030 [Hibiscus cannabinus]